MKHEELTFFKTSINVCLSDIIKKDLEEFYDHIANLAHQPLLQELSYTIIACDANSVDLQITGYIPKDKNA